MKKIIWFKWIIAECVNNQEKQEAEEIGWYDKKRTDPITNYTYYYYEK